ncbi:MAG: hypothetical protein JW395_3198 [Nitrospira sp.]|nr:hypothetical protein [Nitrospira sp.]
MAWVAPRTWTALETATAAMFNGVRDSLLETAPAKATASGDIFYATGANAIARLAAGTNGHVLTLAAGLPSWAAAAGAFIQSLQGVAHYVDSATTRDQAISAVTTGNTALFVAGIGSTHSYADRALCYAELTSTTNIKLTKQTMNNTAHMNLIVVEFKSGYVTLIQRGVAAIGGSTTYNVTITAVTMARAFATGLGSKHTAANELPSGFPSSLTWSSLTSTTNLRITRSAANVDSVSVGWQVVDLASACF